MLSSAWNTEYSFATLSGVSRFLGVVSLKFDFSYDGKTYRHIEYDFRKRVKPGKTMYQIKFSVNNPRIAKIIWD
jgi:hypothetical protein